MASVLSLVLRQQLSVKDVVQWLSSNGYKENTKEILEPLHSERLEFLPFFLNYLREETSGLTQTTQSSGLTPRKSSLQKNVQSSANKCSAQQLTEFTQSKNPTSRTRLFTSPGIPSGHHRTSSKSPVSNHRATRYDGSNYNNNNNNKSCAPSERKLNLGQFIPTNSHPTGNQRKKFSPNNAQQSSGVHFSDAPQRATMQVLNLNDLELFPPVGGSQLKTKDNRRRISPMAASMQKTTKTQDVFSKAFEKEEDSKIKEISEDCKNEFERAENVPNDKESKNSSRVQSVIRTKIALASLEEVTCKDELDVLCCLYCAFIDENFIPNLSVELYFLIQLLTVRLESVKETMSGNEHFLCSVHNCVYFSVQVFYRQRRLLKLLDKSTLNMLADNSRIEAFSTSLKDYLKDIQKNNNQNSVAAFRLQNGIGSVAFQSDTDNRNNFPDDRTFQIFRKQRDEFYAILREWENNHLTPDWSMSAALGKRIYNVICMWQDAALYCHLARLFLNQLIAMCKGDTSDDWKDGVLEDRELLSDFKRTNPEKFKRLQERFTKPLETKGPSPAPSFSGPQEFFCEFITLASCPDFNQHVVDNLIFQISQLNKIEEHLTDNENDSFKEQFTSTLMTLRILAKFLGFLSFRPYKSIEQLPQVLQENSIAMRNATPFVLDMNAIFKDAVFHRKLTLTIPWLVEFLSMMDVNATLLNGVREILVNLVHLYRSSILQLKHEKLSLNKLLLLLSLGWLFEIHSISSLIFFSEIFMIEISSFPSVEDCNSNIHLDFLDLVDHNILYTCCPYLRELKLVLSDFAAGMSNRSSSIKKIVPLAAGEHGEKTSLSIKHLEEQLEDNFFHNQPISLRKTVEFVAERMASNVTKHVKKVIMLDVRQIGYSKIYQEFLTQLANKDKVKKRLFTLKQDLSAEMCNLVKTRTNEVLERICGEKIEPALKLLLAEDMTQSVFVVCCQIASRFTKQKVTQWIATYVVPNLFTEEVQNEIERYKKQNVLSPNKSLVFHPPVSSFHCSGANCQSLTPELGSVSPTDTFIRVKDYVRDMYMADVKDLDNVDAIINDMGLLMMPVKEFHESLKKPVVQLSVDCAFGLIFLQPELMTKVRLYSFMTLWEKQTETECFAGLISPRNLLYLQSSLNVMKSWEKLEDLIYCLLDRNLIVPAVFEKNCFELVMKTWPQEIRLPLVVCLNNLVDRLNDSPKQLKKIAACLSILKSE